MPKPEKPPNFERYVALLARYLKVEPKGAKSAYTSMNGNMYTFLDPDGRLCVRLGKDEQKAFLEKHPGSEVVMYNSVMRGYVGLPAEMFASDDEAGRMLKASFAFAETLPAKPTTKKKSATKKKAATKKKR